MQSNQEANVQIIVDYGTGPISEAVAPLMKEDGLPTTSVYDRNHSGSSYNAQEWRRG